MVYAWKCELLMLPYFQPVEEELGAVQGMARKTCTSVSLHPKKIAGKV